MNPGGSVFLLLFWRLQKRSLEKPLVAGPPGLYARHVPRVVPDPQTAGSELAPLLFGQVARVLFPSRLPA